MDRWYRVLLWVVLCVLALLCSWLLLAIVFALMMLCGYAAVECGL